MSVPMTSALGQNGFRITSLRFWLGLFAFAIFARFVLRDLGIGLSAARSLAGIRLSIIDWAFFAVFFLRIAKLGPKPFADPASINMVLACLLILTFFALETNTGGTGLASGLLGGFLLARSAKEKSLAPIAICLLALFGNFLLAPLVFLSFLDPILSLDYALIATTTRIFDLPIQILTGQMVGIDGHITTLVGACSSFSGISKAILVHVGCAMLIRDHVSWRDGIAVLVTFMLATCLNILRLTLTVQSDQGYNYWHGASEIAPIGAIMIWYMHHAILLTGGFLAAYLAAPPALAAPKTANMARSGSK